MKVVLTGTWLVCLLLELNVFHFAVHADLRTLSNASGDGVSASSWDFLSALFDHTWAVLSADSPTSSLEFSGLVLGVVLTWRCLEELLFLESVISPELSSNPIRGLTLLHKVIAGRVVSRSGSVLLLLTLWREGNGSSHRVGW